MMMTSSSLPAVKKRRIHEQKEKEKEKEKEQQQGCDHVCSSHDEGKKEKEKEKGVEEDECVKQRVIRFVSAEGEVEGDQFNVPLSIHKIQLEQLLHRVLQGNGKEDEVQPYSFCITRRTRRSDQEKEKEKEKRRVLSDDDDGDDNAYTIESVEVTATLGEALSQFASSSSFMGGESDVLVSYFPLAPFRIRPVTRCCSSLEGHSDSVLCVAFSPDSSTLASGSGDRTVRIWDLWTQTPASTLSGHTRPVLCVSWSPDGEFLASAGQDKTIRVWQPKSLDRRRTTKEEEGGKEEGEGGGGGGVLRGHTKSITCLAWQPIHTTTEEDPVPQLLSGSQDCTVWIWDVVRRCGVRCLSGHTAMVTQVRWSPKHIYTASRDTKVFLWNAEDGRRIKELEHHAHWVNFIALNTDYVLRTGAYDHTGHRMFESRKEMRELAKKRYDQCIKGANGEYLVSASDDATMRLYLPDKSRKSIARLTGHQQTVNQALFSPDGRYIASASFDKSVRLWDGRTGKYLSVLRGHVQAVYQLQWSADSRMLVTGSKDSTLMVWDVNKKKLKEQLPGHADAVYAVDWSPDGGTVASGSHDRVVKIWKN